MSLAEDLTQAQAHWPEPVLVPISINGKIRQVETRRVPGLEYAQILSACPPRHAADLPFGYNVNAAALLACEQYGRLLDEDGEPADPVLNEAKTEVLPTDWKGIFHTLDGTQVRAIAASWWALNGGQKQ